MRRFYLLCLQLGVLLLFLSSCGRDDSTKLVARGYFVQVYELNSKSVLDEPLTAYLYPDSLCMEWPYEIVGKFDCRLPEDYSFGDTMYVEATLKKVYPLKNEISFGIGPYYKLKKIARITD
jgi:hypothetical protein